MTDRPVLLDLFCGAGGAAAGYHAAGFTVIGVDLAPQPNYPYEFIQGDALAVLTSSLIDDRNVVAIHASPPCQRYSTVTSVQGDRESHPDLIGPTRDALVRTGLPYIIENVEGARKHMIDPVRLCGSSFGLDLRRHRYFESNVVLLAQPCDHGWQTPRFRSLDSRRKSLASVIGVHGNVNYAGEFPLRCAAMGIDWMNNRELVQSIPPAFTEFLGQQLIDHLGLGEVAA
jgi:DNA (cytosine-5)-methyltransferase 1